MFYRNEIENRHIHSITIFSYKKKKRKKYMQI